MFYGLIIFYKYILLFTIKKLGINLWALVIIKIVKFLLLLFKLKLDYEDDETCYISKKNKNEYLKENLYNYDFYYSLFNLTLEVLDRFI